MAAIEVGPGHATRSHISPITALTLQCRYDVSALKTAALDGAITEELAQARELATALKISGTPGFVARGTIIRGMAPSDRRLAAAATSLPTIEASNAE
ncbi:hypothetical protein [Palleronia caenipelagi]|uniref:DSBA-like thioredoxin domain-containing protein n=1 Tax=Palleronia caenipelagi TaxID=2489174 RepID=A0A547PNT4_9RHOB|nr:hypothetical protein [Palleronia caenipelagi]TRD15781.1 hypothetical protein FEV53_15075 [Palleronia caenipelagi]